MFRLGTSVMVLASLVAVSAGVRGGEKNTADGTWVAVGMEQNGMKIPADAMEKLTIKLILKGDNYTVTMGGMVADKGTSKVDAQKKPHAVDIKSEEGPNKGKTILGIVEIDGDKMKACYNTEGNVRPTEFATAQGSGTMLIMYKREAVK